MGIVCVRITIVNKTRHHQNISEHTNTQCQLCSRPVALELTRVSVLVEVVTLFLWRFCITVGSVHAKHQDGLCNSCKRTNNVLVQLRDYD